MSHIQQKYKYTININKIERATKTEILFKIYLNFVERIPKIFGMGIPKFHLRPYDDIMFILFSHLTNVQYIVQSTFCILKKWVRKQRMLSSFAKM